MKISIRYKEVLADNDSNNSESLDARQYAEKVVIQDSKTKKVYEKSYNAE